MLKRIRIWLGLQEARWWDFDDEPAYVIEGPALAEALRHIHHAGRAAA
jgi:hypothetical protein